MFQTFDHMWSLCLQMVVGKFSATGLFGWFMIGAINLIKHLWIGVPENALVTSQLLRVARAIPPTTLRSCTEGLNKTLRPGSAGFVQTFVWNDRKLMQPAGAPTQFLMWKPRWTAVMHEQLLMSPGPMNSCTYLIVFVCVCGRVRLQLF